MPMKGSQESGIFNNVYISSINKTGSNFSYRVIEYI
jgi:hypothetical protein